MVPVEQHLFVEYHAYLGLPHHCLLGCLELLDPASEVAGRAFPSGCLGFGLAFFLCGNRDGLGFFL